VCQDDGFVAVPALHARKRTSRILWVAVDAGSGGGRQDCVSASQALHAAAG